MPEVILLHAMIGFQMSNYRFDACPRSAFLAFGEFLIWRIRLFGWRWNDNVYAFDFRLSFIATIVCQLLWQLYAIVLHLIKQRFYRVAVKQIFNKRLYGKDNFLSLFTTDYQARFLSQFIRL
jgi:hypothetical protein